MPEASAASEVDTRFNRHFDVNGDGFDDVVVGASKVDSGGCLFAATTSVFHVSAAGVSLTVSRVLEGSAASSELGGSVASAGNAKGVVNHGEAWEVIARPWAKGCRAKAVERTRSAGGREALQDRPVAVWVRGHITRGARERDEIVRAWASGNYPLKHCRCRVRDRGAGAVDEKAL